MLDAAIHKNVVLDLHKVRISWTAEILHLNVHDTIG